MNLKKQTVRGITPRDIKAMNDNTDALWFKLFGNLSFADFEPELKERITSMEFNIGENSSKIEVGLGQIRLEVKNTALELNSKITQTAVDIRSEVNDKVNNMQTQINQSAHDITLKASHGDVKSIITQSPYEIKIGFNKINDKVTITENDFIIKDKNGIVVISNGEIFARALYAIDGTSALKVTSEGVETTTGKIRIYERFGVGHIDTDYISAKTQIYSYRVRCEEVSVINTIDCDNYIKGKTGMFTDITVTNKPWADKVHSHSDITSMLSRHESSLYDIETRLRALENK